MFVLNNGTYTNKKLVFNLNNYSGNWVDNWFKTNESISNSLNELIIIMRSIESKMR